MNNCIFCEIVKGNIPSYKVWEDENYLAFLTISPNKPGHTLLIPKKHTNYIFDLEDSVLGELFIKAKPLAHALRKAFIPKTGKVGIVVAGMGVPHVHVHLIPMDSEKDLSFDNAKDNVKAEEFEEDLRKIKEQL